MARFSSKVERFRSLVQRIFRPEDVDAVLWLIENESSGNPNAVGDGGSSIGLLQLHSRGLGSGMSAAQRRDPEQNLRRAAQAIYGSQGWKPWGGEGNTYNGQPFGAIGRGMQRGTIPPDILARMNGGKAAASRYGAPGPPSTGNTPLLPVNPIRTTALFGPTDEPKDRGGYNKGWDASVVVGTPVKANISGTVVHAGHRNDGWGISVKIRDSEGYIHNFGHLSSANVRVGSQVSKGQTIAKSGNTGASTGPHLSYDVKSPNGEYVDPSRWLGFNAAGDNRQGVDPNAHTQIREVLGFSTSGNRSVDLLSDLRLEPPPELEGEKVYEPSGDFNADASAYWSLSQAAWDELNEIQTSSKVPLIVDESSGTVVKVTGYTIEGEAMTEVDEEATRVLKRALHYESSLDRLYAARQAGLVDNGQDAAAAYLASEQEKAAEASRNYKDYIQRVSDLVAIEDIPHERQATLAATVDAINTANANKGKLDPFMLPQGGPEFSDTSPFADAVRATIPEEAPQPYAIDPKALEPSPTGGLRVRTPEEILGPDWRGGSIADEGGTWQQHEGQRPPITGGPPPSPKFQQHAGQRPPITNVAGRSSSGNASADLLRSNPPRQQGPRRPPITNPTIASIMSGPHIYRRR